MTFRLLYVCVGNVCRSPAAALLTRSWLLPTTPVVVDSGGVTALTGSPIDQNTAVALRRHGIDPDGHVAHQVTEEQLADADLILAADRAIRDHVLASVPQALRRTFTIKEFARIVGQLEPGKPDELVAEAAGSRATFGELRRGADDLIDPYRASPSKAQAVVDEIRDAVHVIVDAMGLHLLDSNDPVGRHHEPPAAAGSTAPRPRPRPRPGPAVTTEGSDQQFGDLDGVQRSTLA